MQSVLKEIERVAERCAMAATAVRELLRKSPQDMAPETILGCAREAERAFRQLCDEVLPQLDAIAATDDDPRVRTRLERLHRLATLHPAGHAREQLVAQLTEAWGSGLQVPLVREFVNVISDYAEGMFCGVELMAAAEHIRYLARYLSTKHALKMGDVSSGNVHVRDLVVSPIFTTNILGSSVGAVVSGDSASAVGTVGHCALTHSQHEEYIKKAKKALVEDEDQLDELVRDAISKFLTLSRKIPVGQHGLAETQARMREILDEVWAAQAAKGMAPRPLPTTLEVMKVLMENPAMGEVTKKLAHG